MKQNTIISILYWPKKHKLTPLVKAWLVFDGLTKNQMFIHQDANTKHTSMSISRTLCICCVHIYSHWSNLPIHTVPYIHSLIQSAHSHSSIYTFTDQTCPFTQFHIYSHSSNLPIHTVPYIQSLIQPAHSHSSWDTNHLQHVKYLSVQATDGCMFKLQWHYRITSIVLERQSFRRILSYNWKFTNQLAWCCGIVRHCKWHLNLSDRNHPCRAWY